MKCCNIDRYPNNTPHPYLPQNERTTSQCRMRRKRIDEQKENKNTHNISLNYCLLNYVRHVKMNAMSPSKRATMKRKYVHFILTAPPHIRIYAMPDYYHSIMCPYEKNRTIQKIHPAFIFLLNHTMYFDIL